MNITEILYAKKLNGGGGGGDFSTANATVQITGDTFIEIPCIINDGISATGIVQSGTYIIPLYKGKAFAYCADSAEITGNISSEDNHFVITGDFTISITNGD